MNAVWAAVPGAKQDAGRGGLAALKMEPRQVDTCAYVCDTRVRVKSKITHCGATQCVCVCVYVYRVEVANVLDAVHRRWLRSVRMGFRLDNLDNYVCKCQCECTGGPAEMGKDARLACVRVKASEHIHIHTYTPARSTLHTVVHTRTRVRTAKPAESEFR